MTAYNKFAKIYDRLMNDFDYESWSEYIEIIFKNYDKKPRNILEMACGTGNLTYHMAKKDYKITAFDLSEEMLSQADAKLNRYSNVNLLNLNMINFNIGEEYDAIISICDSINYILEDRDLYESFKNVWEHLSDGGIFIFDINSKYKLKNIIGDNIFVEDREDIFYIWQNFYDLECDICDFFLTFFLRDGDVFIRFDEEHSQRAYEIDELVKLLKKVGFKKVDYYKAFSLDKVGSNTERINFVAIK